MDPTKKGDVPRPVFNERDGNQARLLSCQPFRTPSHRDAPDDHEYRIPLSRGSGICGVPVSSEAPGGVLNEVSTPFWSPGRFLRFCTGGSRTDGVTEKDRAVRDPEECGSGTEGIGGGRAIPRVLFRVSGELRRFGGFGIRGRVVRRWFRIFFWLCLFIRSGIGFFV